MRSVPHIRVWLTTVILSILLSANPLFAYQIHPNKTRNDSRLANLAGVWARVSNRASDRLLGIFKAPVHEAIAQAAFGCLNDDPMKCADDSLASPAVLWGVRWNDDPPFQMNQGRAHCKYQQTIRANTQPLCWYELFSNAEKRAAAGDAFGPGDALLYRTHLGDLQFLHAMASADGEPAAATKIHIMMWAEFTWGLATGTLRRDVYIKTLGIEGLANFFPGDQSSAILFSLGNPEFQNEKTSEVALGSLLHVVEDSFSKAHVAREEPLTSDCNGMPGVAAPGMITQFHNYARQDSGKHDKADRADALRRDVLEEKVTPIDVSRRIVELWKRSAGWEETRQYLECVFALAPTVQDAGPGEEFER